MENASQALIIAGTVLLAMIVLSVGLYLVVNYSKISVSYEQKKVVEEIRKFNTNFTKYITRTDITAQEIITLKNFAKSYDEKNGTETKVDYPNKKEANDSKKQSELDAEFIMLYAPTETGQLQYFTCNEANIKYDENGRVKEIKFTN